jgi:hypothetical protein
MKDENLSQTEGTSRNPEVKLFLGVIFIAIFTLTALLSIYIIFNDSFFIGFLMLLVSVFGICYSYSLFVKYRNYTHKELKQIMKEKKENPSISKSTREIHNKKDMEKYISSIFMYNSSLNPDNIPKIIEKSKEFNISDYDNEENIRSKYSYNIEMWNIDHGIFRDLNSDFLLKDGEKCIYKNQRCELFETKKVTKRINYAGPRARIKIAKGISYNLGSFGVSSSSSNEEASIGIGPINITNKRLLFKSDIKSISISLDSIISIEPYKDAITVSKSSGKPLTFSVKDGERLYRSIIAAS